MRLSREQQLDIDRCVRRCFGPQAQVLVYGSMLDDQARGGDVDLLVLTVDPPTLRQRMWVTDGLERLLNRPVDLTVAQQHGPASAWVRMVMQRAQPLQVSA